MRRVAAAAAMAAVAATALLFALRNPWPQFVQQHWQALEKKLAAGDQQPQPVAPPTWQAYRRALASSPAELDALLARQAASAAPPSGPSTPVGLSTLWNPDGSRSLGDM
jgi:hypothetical protein